MTLPEPDINPLGLSPELHYLLVLAEDPEAPTTRTEALRRIRKRYPAYLGMGRHPENPTSAAVDAWDRLIRRTPPCVTYVTLGARQGFVLTPVGAERRDLLWENQVFAPFLRRVRAEQGDVVADAVLARERQ